MDDVYCMLQQIRKRPGLYLGWSGKSLTALSHFLHGYDVGITAELRMRKTKFDFTTSNDVFICTSDEVKNNHCLDGFNEFAHDYYGIKMTVSCGEYLILQNTQSEEEAFDKYYELLDIFFAEQRKKVNSPDKGFSGDITT